MKVICRDRRQVKRSGAQNARGMSSVSPELDKLLAPKNHEQLETLEKQVRQKLRSNEPIDVDYWESLLASISIYKAKASLRNVSQSVVGARLDTLRKQQEEEAAATRLRVREALSTTAVVATAPSATTEHNEAANKAAPSSWSDPDPLLKLNADDRGFPSMDVHDFTAKLVGAAQGSSSRASRNANSRTAPGPAKGSETRLHPRSPRHSVQAINVSRPLQSAP